MHRTEGQEGNRDVISDQELCLHEGTQLFCIQLLLAQLWQLLGAGAG